MSASCAKQAAQRTRCSCGYLNGHCTLGKKHGTFRRVSGKPRGVSQVPTKHGVGFCAAPLHRQGAALAWHIANHTPLTSVHCILQETTALKAAQQDAATTEDGHAPKLAQLTQDISEEQITKSLTALPQEDGTFPRSRSVDFYDTDTDDCGDDSSRECTAEADAEMLMREAIMRMHASPEESHGAPFATHQNCKQNSMYCIYMCTKSGGTPSACMRHLRRATVRL